jgi:hypothetical protein
MKANEAPEKIFLHPDIGGREFIRPWLKTRASQEIVEYTRTDAFIEKALAYLNEKFYFNNLHYAVENNTFNCMEEMFEDFEKYMKGE